MREIYPVLTFFFFCDDRKIHVNFPIQFSLTYSVNYFAQKGVYVTKKEVC